MKAIVNDTYGSPDVLRLEEVDKPRVGDDDVLVRTHAASVNSADWDSLRGESLVTRILGGLFKPRRRILGTDIAGRVEEAGKSVMRFRPGVGVFGDLSRCGWGGFAQYACARENALAFIPRNMSFEQAAAIPQEGVLNRPVFSGDPIV